MRCLILVFCCLFSTALYSQSVPADLAGILQFHGVTKKLSEVKDVSLIDELFMRKKSHEDDERNKPSGIFEDSPAPFIQDPALQKTNETETTDITILSNWEGLKSKYLRSDNNIAVGPNHVVQMINSAGFSSYIRVWNKTGAMLINKATIMDLTGEKDYGDPNIIYDEKADRWLISFLYSNKDPKLILIASVTNDPTGAYYYYTFDTPGGFPDYEKLSVWGNSYVVTTAQGTPDVYVINRENVLSGTGATPVLHFPIPKFKNISWQAASPVQETGSLLIPEDEPAIIWRVWDNMWHPPYSVIDQLELFALNINWADPLSSTMDGPIALPIETYNSDLCGINANSCLEQPGTDVRLWPLSNFITDKSKYMNFGDYQSIVGVHVCRVNAEGIAGQRWYELRKYPGGEWSVYQQGTYSPTNDHRFIGSISINADGSIALGYNITSSTIYPGMRMTGRAACDPLNNMTAPETISKSGTASNHSLDYGDYNSLVTDPVDGSFWFSGQYNVSSKWSSNVVHFTINSCVEGKSISEEIKGFSDLNLSPIPVSELLTVSFQSSANEPAQITIYSVAGNLIKSINYDAGIGKNSYSFNTKQFAPGFYILELKNAGSKLTEQFIVSH